MFHQAPLKRKKIHQAKNQLQPQKRPMKLDIRVKQLFVVILIS